MFVSAVRMLVVQDFDARVARSEVETLWRSSPSLGTEVFAAINFNYGTCE